MAVKKLYEHIADAIQWSEHVTEAFRNRADQLLADLEKLLPSGSGIDCGTTIDRELSNKNKIVLRFSFHHMNENGYYTHWTEHKATITPSFQGGFDLKITKNRTDDHFMDYIHDPFYWALRQTYKADWIMERNVFTVV